MVEFFFIRTQIILEQCLDQLCDRLRIRFQQKQIGNDSNNLDNEFAALIVKLLELRYLDSPQKSCSYFQTIVNKIHVH